MTESEAHPFLELIRRRFTVEEFDTRRGLSDDDVRALVADAILAPSSFNIQHWRFIAVCSTEGKQRLRQAAFDQQQVADAAVTFIVLGDVRGVEKLSDLMERAVESGALPPGKAAAWLRMAGQIYTDPQLARDEAMRSGSLAAMTMMLAAEARGLASGALSGFDVDCVTGEFNIDPRYVPVMLLCVGWPLKKSRVRLPRLALEEVLAFERGGRF